MRFLIDRLRPNTRCLAAVILLCFAGIPAQAAEVSVTYDSPERFSDMAGQGSMSFHGRTFERFQKQIEETFERIGRDYLPAGAAMHIEVRDVDLAGEIEPWRRGSASDVRILRDIYPPRIKFHYQIEDSGGETIREGVAQLSDMNYLWGVSAIRNHEDFHYEKELVRDWARRALNDLAPANQVIGDNG